MPESEGPVIKWTTAPIASAMPPVEALPAVKSDPAGVERRSWTASFALDLRGHLSGEEGQARISFVEPIHFSEGLEGGKLGPVDMTKASVNLHGLVNGDAMGLSGWRLKPGGQDKETGFEAQEVRGEAERSVEAGDQGELKLIYETTGNQIVLRVAEKDDPERYGYKKYFLTVGMTRL
ncbi:hypothetical protein HYU90_02140 [Candidatus Collierbacteria bacterium]|nr:hypothetical protein [Candidatus Collierbacteria bacterium]